MFLLVTAVARQTNKNIYPNIYAVFLDCLPVQSVSISCKRMFSTTEDTAALIAGKMSWRVFKARQRLRFAEGKEILQDTVWEHLNYLRPTFTDRYSLEHILKAIENSESPTSGSDSD